MRLAELVYVHFRWNNEATHIHAHAHTPPKHRSGSPAFFSFPVGAAGSFQWRNRLYGARASKCTIHVLVVRLRAMKTGQKLKNGKTSRMLLVLKDFSAWRSVFWRMSGHCIVFQWHKFKEEINKSRNWKIPPNEKFARYARPQAKASAHALVRACMPPQRNKCANSHRSFTLMVRSWLWNDCINIYMYVRSIVERSRTRAIFSQFSIEFTV